MSILIHGMEIPTSCEKCRFCVNGFTDDAPMYECAVQSYDNVSVTVDYSGKPFDFRPAWCPLVELPEIIYCGDCKYKDDGIGEDGIPFLKCLHGKSYGGTRINDFCSWAERREVTT